jgi:hypothetical protein
MIQRTPFLDITDAEWERIHHDPSAVAARYDGPRRFLRCRQAGRMTASLVRRDKAALLQRVQAPPGTRSSRKQPEQAWR